MFVLTKKTGTGGLDYLRASDYGVSPTSTAAANTAGLAQAIAAGVATRKNVHLPSGVLPVSGPVLLDQRIRLIGEGRENSILKAAAAMPAVVRQLSRELLYPMGAGVAGVGVDCAGLAQTGFELHAMAFINYEDLFVINHLGYGLDIYGCLIASFTDVMIREGNQGIRVQNRPDTAVSGVYGKVFTLGTGIGQGVTDMPPNLIQFIRPNVSVLNGRAFDYRNGSNLAIIDADFEQTGKLLDANTANIYIAATNSLGEGMASRIQGGWAEVQWGGPLIEYGEPAGTSLHSIRDFQYNGGAGDSAAGIKITGNTFENVVTLDNVQIKNLDANSLFNGAASSSGPAAPGKGLIVVGAKATAYLHPNCRIRDGVTAENAGTILTLSTGTAAPTTTTTTQPTAAARYSEQVAFDQPIYYNRMVTNAAGTATPVIGTGTLTLRGGATGLSGTSATPNDPTSNSVRFSGAGQWADVPLNLSAFTEVIFECWLNLVASPQTGGFLTALGNTWDSTPGGFIYAPALPSTPNFAYAAVSGNAATGNDVGFSPPYPPALAAGVHHIVVHYRQNDVIRYIVNGVVVPFTSDVSPGNTNTFANSILYLAGNPTGSYLNCFIQDLAIYGTNLPSTARFQAHYAARNN